MAARPHYSERLLAESYRHYCRFKPHKPPKPCLNPMKLVIRTGFELPMLIFVKFFMPRNLKTLATSASIQPFHHDTPQPLKVPRNPLLLVEARFFGSPNFASRQGAIDDRPERRKVRPILGKPQQEPRRVQGFMLVFCLSPLFLSLARCQIGFHIGLRV